MRIELNSGGLGGTASISSMQSELTNLISRSDSLLTAFNHIKTYMYNMNGGVGCLQEALKDVATRIQVEESRSSNINTTYSNVNSFVELTKSIDLNVGRLVNQNKNEFYEMNPWSKPPQKEVERKWYGKLYDLVCSTRDSITETVKKAWSNINSFCSSVGRKIEKFFTEFQEWWKDYMFITPMIVEDDVFNSDKASTGYYGADQGRPTKNVLVDGYLSDDENAYFDILIANTGKEDFSEDELKTYLDELNHHGCGYAALTNVVMEYYCNRPNGEQEFYNKFGFSMRKADGNLNFDKVIVDLYSKQNGLNHTSVNTESFGIILSQYMGDTETVIKVDKNVKVTAKNYDNYIREGKQVVVMGWDFPLYYDEDKLNSRVCGGHGMIVTGVTDSGMLIVSTWGGKAYIDPKDNNKLVTKDGKLTKSELTFQTVEFER